MYFNHFLPLTKLLQTEHRGSRMKKIYDAPQTPYQRVLDSAAVDSPLKTQLRREHVKLDVVHLKQHLDELLMQLKPTKRW